MSNRYPTPISEMTEVHVGGRRLSCLVCANDTFGRREIKLNTTGMSFFGLDWANRSGVGAICLACGFVHTFLEGAIEWRVPQDGPAAPPH